MGAGFRVRSAAPRDIPSLPAIERAASRRFAELGLEAAVLTDVTTIEALTEAARAGLLFVAEDLATADAGSALVGFAFCQRLGADLLLGELDVLPSHGRRGIGSALVRHVLEHAHQASFESVVLTTYRDVAWNAPLYARLGFEPVARSAWSRPIQDLVSEEDHLGLRAEERVVMRFPLAPAIGRPG